MVEMSETVRCTVIFILENLLLLIANGWHFFLHILQIFDVIICSVSLYFEFNHGQSNALVCTAHLRVCVCDSTP